MSEKPNFFMSILDFVGLVIIVAVTIGIIVGNNGNTVLMMLAGAFGWVALMLFIAYLVGKRRKNR